jgi:hypothetical protein
MSRHRVCKHRSATQQAAQRQDLNCLACRIALSCNHVTTSCLYVSQLSPGDDLAAGWPHQHTRLTVTHCLSFVEYNWVVPQHSLTYQATLATSPTLA